MERKLYRNPGDAVLGGVASGIATYLNIDKTLIRVLWVASLLLPIPPSFFWTGVLYLILWAVLPEGTPAAAAFEESAFSPRREATEADEKRRRDQTVRILGIALVGFGAVMLFDKLPIWYEIQPYIWPVGLMVAGAYLLLRQRDQRGGAGTKVHDAGTTQSPPEYRQEPASEPEAGPRSGEERQDDEDGIIRVN